MGALVSDFRTAVRALARSRGFTAIAVLTLGAGLALSLAALTAVNAYVVRGLPYPEADRLFRISYGAPDQDTPDGLEQLDWSSLGDVIEEPIAWDLDMFYLLGGDYPESSPGTWVTPGYMRGFGITVAVGRGFGPDDYRPGRPAVALISHALWQTRFGGRTDIVGRQFEAYVSDRPEEPEVFTIVGVLPAKLWHLNPFTQVMAPLRAPNYPYMARLRDGVAPEVGAERITTLVRHGLPSVPADFAAVLSSVSGDYSEAVRPVLWAVSASAALVLLIAGANVAVLMLIRGRRRQREVAVRVALGASRGQVARMLMVEGAIIGLAATVIGLVGSGAIMLRVSPLIESALNRRVPGGPEALVLEPPLAVGASVVGLLVALVFTVVPVLFTWRGGLAPSLAAGRTATEGLVARRWRAALIGVEVAASMTLLVGAALMVESAIRMVRVDFGLDADRVVSASLALRQRTFPDEATRAAFYESLTTRLAGTAAATVALGDRWPLQALRPTRVHAAGGGESGDAALFAVSPDYFAALGISLVDGRPITSPDRFGGQPVAVVSRTAAQRLWRHGRAVGERLNILGDNHAAAVTAVVVGIVSDVRQSHLDVDLVDVYVPLSQRPGRFADLYLRDPQSPTWEADLRRAVAQVDPEVALGNPRRLESALEQERARPRFLAGTLAAVALFASVLALIGVHGVIAYAVRQREREIALRIAIGADVRAITSMFLRQGAFVLLAGLSVGLAGAIALGRVLESQLHGVRPAEPRVLLLAAVVFALLGFAAVWWPARRGATIDPMLALKADG